MTPQMPQPKDPPIATGGLCSPRQVPAFEAAEFAPRRSDYCACVFVINENGKLHKQLAAMQQYAAGIDVVIADGGSTDGSTDPDELGPLGVNTLLTKTGPGKLGAQMRMAFAWALDRGYQGVVSMDGNGKDGPDALPRFVEKLEEGYDHVQGSRFVRGGVSENLPLSRWLGVRLVHAPLISLASRFRYTDTTNGFRAYSRRLLEDPRVDAFRDVFAGYELHYYLAIRAARLGFNVCEIPVARRYPAKGPIPTKISPVRGNLRVLRCLFAACLGRYNPTA
jgi:dolichol-phosphate mannosyltransferase